MTPPTQIASDANRPIVLFDGLCNYCHFMVQLAIRFDPDKKLRFASLSSQTGARLQAEYAWRADLDSMVLIENNRVYTHSTAVLKALRHLQAPISWLSVFRFIPSFLRDPLYKWVAAHRYRWFGKKDQCPLPSRDQLSRFLP